MSFWEPGDQIVWRWGDPAGPHFAEPVTVVRDDDVGLVVWLAAGTPVLRKARADGRSMRSDKATMFSAPMVQVLETWTDYDVLRVAPAGRPWSMWCFFNAGTHGFEGWYVNIEEVHTRDEGATYSKDHVLDVWVEPDRTHGRKDEDELVEAVRQGRDSPTEAERITKIAAEVEALIDAWASPFRDGWEKFTPDPSWPIRTRPH